MREPVGYRDTLAILIANHNGECVVSKDEAKKILGIKSNTTWQRRKIPCIGNTVALTTIAMILTKGC